MTTGGHISLYTGALTGKPLAEQCEGCTLFTTHINELSYLHSRDVSYATFCEGLCEESAQYRKFMG